MEENLTKTCLHDRHVALGALMSPFGGFDMPIQYKGITEEHNAVRHEVGVFDVSHMGEVRVKGADACKFVNHIFVNDVTGAPDGQIFYGMMCNEKGGTVDDLLVYKVSDDEYFLVINASNIAKDVDWILKNSEGFDVEIIDQSPYYGEVAIQGPKAEETVEQVLNIPVKDIPFYNFKTIHIDGEDIIVSRTGYTGEDGFEVYGSHDFTRKTWDKLMDASVQPCGLGCRDTLRFEVGLPLYGDELSEDITPIEASLSMFVKLDKPEFIGKEALATQKADGVKRRIVGIELEGNAIPRHGYPVEIDGKQIGEITTGYRSISTGKSVAMAMIEKPYDKLGTNVEVRIRKKTFPAKVIKKRFYDKNYKK
ncbi:MULTISPECIES: glycine cleavage system aminomethyltransferase GcvT [Bacteroidales]|jgi:aminomethyltransferase|uniref:Glycine cleavage system aminomethyltransferase GcvT n=1 Tax=Lepagella muris TaxID=3032870 RepID=A0AC61RIK8_9BACT|nr:MULTISPECIES: glycine cleavage system aminomethyltransferase GcvT [Bacteroidales]ROT03724.1 glycine cleavage system aminomethyltransferase GcvT [Muribaculaceae bacterium Isolate-037 (Harlan)]TGY77101.1 glycine cleavage system aminomethyltransferase GcvT [Lepagella muris]THG48999.1 glycine cleavage system aminomethyltransferase GcvT [Bacteroidales bacterium]TKC55360.1 glycine cleavage system aminomethyltransferase GcvT [Bacteroidales bacterium]